MRGALLRLALLLALLAAISGFQWVRADQGTPVTLAAGALLLCGLFAGKVAASIGLPRLTGYLLIGIVIGPYVLRLVPVEGVVGLDLAKGLAISLIALGAGTELRLGLIRRVGKKVLLLCVAVSASVFVTSAAALVALRPFLPFLQAFDWIQTVSVSALTATVIVSFSPTVTLAIIQETSAKGPFTEFLMALVIIADLVVMVAFAICAGLTRAAVGGSIDFAGLAGGIGWELFGSLFIGAGIGLLTLLYLRQVGKEVPIFICAMCFVCAEMGTAAHLSPLLLSLAAGATIANLDEYRAESLNHAIEKASLPLFALFFAVAGAGLHLDVLKSLGLVAAALVVVRTASIFVSVRRFAPKDDERLKRFLWMGLVSQAGVSLGLAALIGRSFPSFGPQVETLLIAVIIVGELAGPIMTRKALERAGEVSGDVGLEKV